MGNVCRRRNEQTTELGDAIHGTVDRVDEATIHVLQTEGENLTINTEIDDLRNQSAALTRENERLKHEIFQLTESVKYEKEKIDKEREQLDKEKEKVLSLNAPSYQARKMHGDVTPGSMTHEDIKSEYIQFFKYWIRNLPNKNKNITDTKSVQQSLSPLFQTCFNLSCNIIIEIMSKQLRELLQDPCNDSEDEKEDLSAQEKLKDICIAFSLLLYHADINTEDVLQYITKMTTDSFEKQVEHQKIKFPNEAIQKASKIAWSMVTQVPPMICSEPQTFSEKLHEIKDCNWQVKDGPYELVYMCPVLFHGRHGAVAVQGQVGNQEYAAKTVFNIVTKETHSNEQNNKANKGGSHKVKTEAHFVTKYEGKITTV